MQLSTIKNAIHKFVFSLFWAITLFVIAGIIFFFGFSLLRPDAFTVLWGNFDMNYRKLPFDQKSIDFVLSKELDQTSVKNENFEISPKVDGTWSMKDDKTLSFTFGEKLTVGDEITFTLKSSLISKKWEALGQDYNYDIHIVSAPKIVKITPSGNLENLSQNIAVFFNIPMVSLSTLWEKEEMPCPLKITPKLEGTCKWTTSSVLEFVPKTSFAGATKYTLEYENVPGLLYTISDTPAATIQTPNLQYFHSSRFTASEGIAVHFNFPVWKEQLEKNIEVYGFGSWKIDSNYIGENIQNLISQSTALENIEEKNLWPIQKKEFEVIPTDTKTDFFIRLKNATFDHSNVYKIVVKKWLTPLEGNVPFAENTIGYTLSYPFLQYTEVYRDILSQTGAKIDTQNYGTNVDTIPAKNVFFHLLFEKELSTLQSSLFSFQDASWTLVPFDVTYVEESSWSVLPWKEPEKVQNKKKIRLSLKNTLKNGEKYTLRINKQLDAALKEDIVQNFITAGDLAVVDYKFVGYEKSCLYFNHPIENIWTKRDTIIATSPASKVSGVTDYEWIPYEIEKYKDEEIVKNWYCPRAQNGNSLVVVNTRLNPKSDYIISSSTGVVDIYGNTLKTPLEKKVTTWEIQDKDKYLYISLSKETNVIPSQIPITLNLQTINMDSVDVDVCQLQESGYLDYVVHRYDQNFQPKCTKTTKLSLGVKNKFWTLSNNKFDLENDVLKEKATEKILLVRWYKSSTEKSFETIFIRSNLSLVFEKATNKSLLFATDFYGEAPNETLQFEFYNYDYAARNFTKVSPKYSYNEEKKVYEFTTSDFTYAIAKSKNYFWFLDFNNDSFSNYDFRYVGWVSAYEKNYLYLYTDRPIYKPGDTVSYKGLLREFDITGYKKSSIQKGKLDVYDEGNSKILSFDVQADANGNFNGSFVIPKDIALWRVSFIFNAPDVFVKNDAYFHVEEYVKPPFKVWVSDVKTDFVLWETLKTTVTPTYYFWGKLSRATWMYSILTQNYYFDAKDFSNYQFGDDTSYFDCVYWGYCQYNDFLSGTHNFTLWENGDYDLTYDFSKKPEDGEKIYSFNIDITDTDTGNVVSKSVSKVLHKTDGYVGLDAPYWTPAGKTIEAKVVTLDYMAQPLPSKKVQAELYTREWKSVKKQGVDGIFYDDYSLEEKLEQSTSTTTDANGIWSISFTPKAQGEYLLKVRYTWANGQSFDSSMVLYVSSDEYINWYSGNNDITELTALKTLVKLKDTASYILKSPVNHGKVLVTIEKDDGILDYFIHNVTSYGDKIDIPVKDTYYPNFYVRAFLIGYDPLNPLPVYKRALSVTKVATDYKNLTVEIKTDKETYTPWEKMKVQVTVKNSKWNPVWVNGSLSVVDESVLALKGNPKKNPYAFFYDMKRYLGTFTVANLKNLIEKLEVKDTGNGEKWWAGETAKWWDSVKKRGNFKDTAFWKADFQTDANGQATIETDALPDNLTTWVIEALLNSTEDNKVWVAYASVTTSQQLLIVDNLPAFFVWGDSLKLVPQVFNKTKKDEQVELTLVASWVKVTWKNTQTVTVKAGESLVVPFTVEVSQNMSSTTPVIAKVDFTAKTTSWLSDGLEKKLPVFSPMTSETTATTGKTKDVSYDEHINLWKGLSPLVTLRFSPTLLSHVSDGIDYLNNYPYGCSEQKTSSILPNVLVKNLYNALGASFDLKTKMIDYYSVEKNAMVQKSLESVISEYLVDIRKFQNTDGGFVYFYDMDTTYRPNYSDFALTSYILSSGAAVNDIGLVVEKAPYTQAIKYLKNRYYKNQREGCIVSTWDDCTYSPFERLQSLSAILSFSPNDYEVYKMWKLLTLKNEDASIKLQNALVMSKLAKLKDLADTEKKDLITGAQKKLDEVISEELVFTPRGSFIGRTLTSTRLLNTALFLETVSTLWIDTVKDSETIIDNINRWMIAQKKDGSFGSTQDTLCVIRAFTAYIGASKELEKVSFLAKFKLNGNEVGSQKIDDTNKLEVFTQVFSGAQLQSKNVLNITKDGNGTLYYDMQLQYSVPVDSVEARDEWFSVVQDYYDYDTYRKIETQKKQEWEKYVNSEIAYESLKFPKSVFEYITPIKDGKVSQLVVVRNRLITSETRDKVAFESFVPAGSQLINPNLDTSSKAANAFTNDIFEKQEYRLDRYFGFTTELQPGIYDVSFLVRMTHTGTFVVKPTKAYEFYNTEVFGRSAGKTFEVK